MRLTEEMSHVERTHLDTLERLSRSNNHRQNAVMSAVCFGVLALSWVIGMVWP